MSAAGRMGDFVASDVHDTTPDERQEAGQRPTGEQMFATMTQAEQDAALGKTAAEKVRSGEASLADFVAESNLATQENFITQASAKDAPN